LSIARGSRRSSREVGKRRLERIPVAEAQRDLRDKFRFRGTRSRAWGIRFALEEPRQTNVDERFALEHSHYTQRRQSIDSPELGVIRKGVDGVNSFSHWPI